MLLVWGVNTPIEYLNLDLANCDALCSLPLEIEPPTSYCCLLPKCNQPNVQKHWSSYHLRVYHFHLSVSLSCVSQDCVFCCLGIHTVHTLNLGGSILWAPTYFMHKLFNIFTNILIQHPATTMAKVQLLLIKCQMKAAKAWPICVVVDILSFLQTLSQLKSDNQRLRDENQALVAVISGDKSQIV